MLVQGHHVRTACVSVVHGEFDLVSSRSDVASTDGAYPFFPEDVQHKRGLRTLVRSQCRGKRAKIRATVPVSFGANF